MRYDPKNDNMGAFRIGDAEPTGNRDKGRQRLEPFKKKSRNPFNDVKLPLSMEEDLRRRTIKTLKQAGMTERQAISSLNETAKQLQTKNRFPSIRKMLLNGGLSPADVDKIINNVAKALNSVEMDVSASLRKYLASPMHTECATPAFGTPLSDAILKGNGAGSVSVDADKIMIKCPGVIPAGLILTKSAIVQSASRSHRPNQAPVVVQVLKYRDIDASIKKAAMGKHKVTLESLGIHPAKNDADAVDNQKDFLFDVDFSQVYPQDKPTHVMPTTDGIHPYAKSYVRGFPAIQINDEAHMVKSGHVRPNMQDIRDALNMKPKKQVPR